MGTYSDFFEKQNSSAKFWEAAATAIMEANADEINRMVGAYLESETRLRNAGPAPEELHMTWRFEDDGALTVVLMHEATEVASTTIAAPAAKGEENA